MTMTRSNWIDPEIAESLCKFPDFDFSAANLPAMRAGTMFKPQSAPDIERVELTTQRGEVAISLLRPVSSADRPPVLYWMHGGGMVIGNRYMDDARLIEWCRWLGCVCVSVEYRLAPEAPAGLWPQASPCGGAPAGRSRWRFNTWSTRCSTTAAAPRRANSRDCRYGAANPTHSAGAVISATDTAPTTCQRMRLRPAHLN